MTLITDGTWTTPQINGKKKQSYPFDYLANPFSVVWARRYLQLGSSYTGSSVPTRLAKINYIMYSQEFDNAAWVKTGSTVTANQVTNPIDGATDADSVLEAAGVSAHSVAQAYTANAVPHTFTVFVKPNGRQWVALEFTDSGATSYSRFFDTTNVATGVGSATGTITATNDGWFKITLTLTPAAGAGTMTFYLASANGTATYAGDITKGAYLYGALLDRVATTNSPYIQTTSGARLVSYPNTDALDHTTLSNTDPNAFLVTETPPEDSLLEIGLVGFTRQYARIPATQVEYTTKLFNRPILDDVFIASSAWAISFDRGITSHVFTARKTVTSVGTYTPGTTSVNNPAGGLASLPNHTIFIAQTSGLGTTFLMNGSPSSIRTQIAAACPAITGLTVEGTGNTLVIQWTGGVAYCYTTSLSVQASFSSTGVTFTSFGASSTSTYTPQAATSLRVINSTSHGGAVGDLVALWNGDTIIGRGRIVTVPNANSFTIPLDSLPGSDFTVTTCQFGKNGTRYVNGIKSCTVKRSNYFYLPGFTLNITTAADIPNFSIYTDPISWLGQLLSNPAGFAAVEVSELSFWMGPIYTQIVDEIQMADAIDTVTP